MHKTPENLPLVYHPDYEMDIGNHVFSTAKYRLALDLLRHDGYALAESIRQPQPASREELLTVLTAGMLADLDHLQWTARTIFSELPLSEGIVRGFKLMTGGTILATRLALEQGLAVHVGGGFHHGFADHAEGFCYINDIAVAIRVAQREGLIRRAAVIDVDLHQGNGTAHIFLHDPDVLTFSIHQEMLYPVEKQRSDIDIGLERFIGDEGYLRQLGSVVPRRIAEHRPELVVYVAGADPFEEDQLGDLRLTMEGLRRRDRLVAEAARAEGWPLVAVLAGGYARNPRDTARIHANMAIELAGAFGIEPRPS